MRTEGKALRQEGASFSYNREHEASSGSIDDLVKTHHSIQKRELYASHRVSYHV